MYRKDMRDISPFKARNRRKKKKRSKEDNDKFLSVNAYSGGEGANLLLILD